MNAQPGRMNQAFIYVTSLFFAWGFITATLDTLVPLVKSVFTLSYSESLLTQFAFFLSYGIISLPASSLVARKGSAASIIIALVTMVVVAVFVGDAYGPTKSASAANTAS